MTGARIQAGNALGAAAVYAGVVFVFAVFSGAMRTLAVAADIGVTPVAAVLVEVPVILVVAWVVCGVITRMMCVPAGIPTRLVMAAASLLIMLAAEYVFALLLAELSLHEFIATYARLDVQIGLAGQLVFAGIPMMRRRM